MAAIIGAIFSNLMRLTGINEHARMISVAIEEGQKMISFKNVMLSAIMVKIMAERKNKEISNVLGRDTSADKDSC